MSGPLALSPLGAARTRFLEEQGKPALISGEPPIPAALARAVAEMELDEAVLYRAWELARCAGLREPAALRGCVFLLAACLLNQQSGSTRLPLSRPGPLDELLKELGASDADQQQAWALLAEAGPESTLVGAAGELKPLVVDGEHLYLQRMLKLEERVAGVLRALIDAPPVAMDEERVRRALGEVAGAGAAGGYPLTEEQQLAVLTAVYSRLAVISGGPGTGKTSIVVALLRVLARLGVPMESVALAAPTGKAANRMGESIRKSLSLLELSDDCDRALAGAFPEPKTLHRLLGYLPQTESFRHHAGNPLAERVVIVDEGSMVDLSLMDQLVRALRPEARLVLLGDAEQLPSVEAGAVFRDLVAAPAADVQRPWAGLVLGAKSETKSGTSSGTQSAAKSGAKSRKQPQARSGAKAKGPSEARARCAVRLTQSFRMSPSDPSGRAILEVAARVNRGSAAELLNRESGLLAFRDGAQSLQFDKVEFIPSCADEDREAFLERWFGERLWGDGELWSLSQRAFRHDGNGFVESEVAGLQRLFAHLQSAKVLCITREETRGTGARAVNADLHARALERAGGRGEMIAGEPVMMLRNDVELGLFNGDQGIVLRVADPQGVRLRAVFARAGGFAGYHLDALRPELRLSYAMTVHKAQGSEFDHVALVLPKRTMPLLSREIVYTAVTRSRKSVVILGTEEVFAAAVERRLERFSGLGDRLDGPAPRGPM